MSFKKLSILAVLFLVVLFLAGRVLAAVVASMTIQDQQLDLSVPNASVNITLSGDPNEAKTFNIPITITHDDGSTRYLAYTFNYVVPSTPQPAAQTCDYEEDAPSCPNGGLQTCTGTWQEGECRYDSSIDPNCRNIRCNEAPAGSEPPPPPPPPEPSCGDFEYKYWECDWDNQQTYDVYQDSCGNYDRRDYHVVEGLCGAPE